MRFGDNSEVWHAVIQNSVPLCKTETPGAFESLARARLPCGKIGHFAKRTLFRQETILIGMNCFLRHNLAVPVDQTDVKMRGKRLIRRIFQAEFQRVPAGTERPHSLRKKSFQMKAVPPVGKRRAFHRNIIDPEQKIPVRFELKRVFAVRRHHA